MAETKIAAKATRTFASKKKEIQKPESSKQKGYFKVSNKKNIPSCHKFQNRYSYTIQVVETRRLLALRRQETRAESLWPVTASRSRRNASAGNGSKRKPMRSSTRISRQKLSRREFPRGKRGQPSSRKANSKTVRTLWSRVWWRATNIRSLPYFAAWRRKPFGDASFQSRLFVLPSLVFRVWFSVWLEMKCSNSNLQSFIY